MTQVYTIPQVNAQGEIIGEITQDELDYMTAAVIMNAYTRNSHMPLILDCFDTLRGVPADVSAALSKMLHPGVAEARRVDTRELAKNAGQELGLPVNFAAFIPDFPQLPDPIREPINAIQELEIRQAMVTHGIETMGAHNANATQLAEWAIQDMGLDDSECAPVWEIAIQAMGVIESYVMEDSAF